MSLGHFLLGFLPPIAIGTVAVLALLLLTWLGIPRRSAIASDRRTML